MSKAVITSIPVPRPDFHSLVESVNALKHHTEYTNGGNRKNIENAYVSIRDLLSLGIAVYDENGALRQMQRSDISKITLLDRNVGKRPANFAFSNGFDSRFV